MRRVIVSNITSLDGYIAGPGGNPTVLPMDPSFDDYNVERLRSADTLLLGRNSFEMFRGFWPTVQDDPAASPTNREISRLNNAIEKVVISDSLTSEETAPWTNTTIVKRSEAEAQVAELKAQSGGDILVFGSRTMWNALLAAGLVDELHLMVGNVIVGTGTSLFDGTPPVSLELIDTRTFDGSGNVLLRYAVTHPEA